MSKPRVKSAAVEGEMNQNQPHPKQHLNYVHHLLHDITPDACTRESSVTSQATLKLTSRESWCMAGETCAAAPPSAEPESTKHSSTSATCNTHFIPSLQIRAGERQMQPHKQPSSWCCEHAWFYAEAFTPHTQIFIHSFKLTSRESWYMAGEICAAAPPSAEGGSYSMAACSRWERRAIKYCTQGLALCNTHLLALKQPCRLSTHLYLPLA